MLTRAVDRLRREVTGEPEPEPADDADDDEYDETE